MKSFQLTVAICVAAFGSLLAIWTGEETSQAREAPTPTTIYVSKSGSDAWSGRFANPNEAKTDGPVASLERAKELAREYRQEGTWTVVEVDAGLYELAEPLRFTAEDGGESETNRVVWRARKDAKVTISAGRYVTGAKKVADPDVLAKLPQAARDKIYVVDLSDQQVGDLGTPASGVELFYQGKPTRLARYPNDDFIKITELEREGTNVVDIRGTKGVAEGKFFFDDGEMARCVDEPDLWVDGYWFWDWAEQKHKVVQIDPVAKRLEVAPPYHVYGYRVGQWFYVFNAFCELDEPGEFYVDREKKALYFYPYAPFQNDEDLLLTRLTNAVVFSEVEHFTFSGFSILGARDTAISCQGWLNDVKVERCDVSNCGGSGIYLVGSNLIVSECELWNLGAAGISVSGGDRKTLEPSRNMIVNNYAHDYARIQRVYAPGIRVDGVGAYVAHNLVENAPHMGMGFGGNDHLFELNEIANVCQESNDAGAIYTGRNWTMRGNILRYNYLHDITGFRNNGCVGIYLDDMFSSADIVGNLFVNVTRAAFIGGGRDCKIADNLFVNCNPAVHVDARGAGWANDHIQGWLNEEKEKGTLSGIKYNEPPYSTKYPELASILDEGKKPEYPEGSEVTGNVCVGGTWDVNKSGQWQGKTIEDAARPYLKIEGNFYAESDDGSFFVDAAHGDYRLKEDSKPILNGFVPPPIDQMGLTSERMLRKAKTSRAR